MNFIRILFPKIRGMLFDVSVDNRYSLHTSNEHITTHHYQLSYMKTYYGGFGRTEKEDVCNLKSKLKIILRNEDSMSMNGLPPR